MKEIKKVTIKMKDNNKTMNFSGYSQWHHLQKNHKLSLANPVQTLMIFHLSYWLKAVQGLDKSKKLIPIK